MAHFEWVGGRLALDFTNTASWGGQQPHGERLIAFSDLLDWGRDAGVIAPERHQRLRADAESRPGSSYRALERARLVRELLHRLLTAVADHAEPDPALVAAFNHQLTQSLAQLRLSDAADALRWIERDQDLDSVLHPVIWSAAQILSSSDRQRLRRCANDNCGWLFVDQSRNHKRKWCEMRECGNRAKAARYYARHRNRPSESA
ncbi:MAG TPA: CGNR zinc finger domain-containing protein [Gemmatimonadaceae bacterium]|nr:CGNR zinc finger domain-containing protein [Gemmatimonadaceae bacterium]